MASCRRTNILGVFFVSTTALATALTLWTVQFVNVRGHHYITAIASACLFIQMPFLMTSMAAKQTPFNPPPGKLVWVLIRASCAAAAWVLMHISGLFIPLGDVSALGTLAVGFTMLFGRLCLHERYSIFQTFAMVLIIAGGIIVSQPTILFNPASLKNENLLNRIIGTSIALGSALFYTTLTLVHRRHLRDTDPILTSTYTGIMQALCATVILLVLGETFNVCDLPSRAMIVVFGVLIFISNCAYNASLTRLSAGLNTLLFYGINLVCCFLLQLMGEEIPNLWTLIGVSIISCGLILNFIGAMQNSKHANILEETTDFQNIETKLSRSEDQATI